MNKNIIILFPSYVCSGPVMPSSYSNNEPYFETKSQNKPCLLEAAFVRALGHSSKLIPLYTMLGNSGPGDCLQSAAHVIHRPESQVCLTKRNVSGH